MLTVRNIYSNLANGMSRVSIDKANFKLIRNSSFELSQKRVPEFKPVETLRSKSGIFYNKYIIDGITILYHYNKNVDENQHECFMDTTIANSLYKPYVSEYAEIDLDTAATVEGLVTA